MAIFNVHHPLSLTFGILGNIFSFMVYLAPLPTFYGVYKKKSTQGFQSVPYVFALLSAMSWIYYAFLKSNTYLLITINSFGCAMEIIYITTFIIYATRKARILTIKLILLLNVGIFSMVFLLTIFLAKGTHRVYMLGWVCLAISTSVFAAPFSIMRLVIRTKSVEFMPFSLSFFLTLSAIMWFGYGIVLKDYFVAVPNVVGFIFGVIQMVLYAIYKDNKVVMQAKLPEQNIDIIKLEMADIHEINITPMDDENKMCQDQKVDEEYDNKIEKNMHLFDANQMIQCEV